METRVAKAPEPQRKSIQVVQSLSVVVNNTTNNVTNTRITNTNTNINTNNSTRIDATKTVNPVKFEKITPEAKKKIATQAADVKKFRDDRKGWESAAADPKAVKAADAQKAPVVPPTAKEPVAVQAADRQAPAVRPRTRQCPLRSPSNAGRPMLGLRTRRHPPRSPPKARSR